MVFWKACQVANGSAAEVKIIVKQLKEMNEVEL